MFANADAPFLKGNMAKKYEVKFKGITDKAGAMRLNGEILDATEIADVQRLLGLEAIAEVVEAKPNGKAADPAKPNGKPEDGKAADPAN